MSTKIEWTDALFPMASFVTGIAKSYHVEPVAPFIAKMVMVLGSRAAAIKTWQAFRRGETFHLHCVADRIDGPLLNSLRWCLDNSGPSHRDAATVPTRGSQAVVARGVYIEACDWLPRLAFSARLQPGFNPGLIFRQAQPEPSSGDFRGPNLSLCHGGII